MSAIFEYQPLGLRRGSLYGVEMARPKSARSIPVTRWTSVNSQWKPSLGVGLILVLGLTMIGFGEAFLVMAGFGNSPWTVFAQGLADRLGVSIGTSTFVVGVSVLLTWIALRVRPGIGTIANVIVTAYAIDFATEIVPQPHLAALRWLFVLLGPIFVGSGAVIYLTCRLGPGPRDGLMTGIHARSGWAVPRVRLCIELTVLLFGWLLGGTIGAATLIYALLVPKVVGVSLYIVGKYFGTATDSMKGITVTSSGATPKEVSVTRA